MGTGPSLPPLALAALAVLAMAPTTPAADPADAAAWRSWHERREARLREPEGWLALTALHWLVEGENHVEGLPGAFVLEGGRVTLRAAPGDGYSLGGAPVAERVLASDADPEPDRLHQGTRVVQVIRRGDALAIRVWDSDSPARRAFRGVETFPYDPRWRIEARWEPYPEPRQVEQPSAAGPPQKALAPGKAISRWVAGRCRWSRSWRTVP